MIRKFRKQQRICGASSASIAKLVARGKLHTRAAARALAVLSGRRSARGQAIDVTVRISQGGRSTFRSRPDEPNHLIISNHNPSCRDGVFDSIRTIRKISEPKNLANAFVRVTVVTRNSGMFSLTEKARLFCLSAYSSASWPQLGRRGDRLLRAARCRRTHELPALS